MTTAFLGFQIASGDAVTAEKNLSQMTKASVQAENAADQLRAKSAGAAAGLQSVSVGAQAQATAMVASTARTNANTAALQANAAASRMASFQVRNLQFQLFDIAQTAAMGMNPLLIFMQQGPQIAQIWGPDEGGVGRAFRETGRMIGGVLTRFPLLTAAVAGAGLALAGLTYEINQVSDVTVTMGDVALATWQTIVSGIQSVLAPAFAALTPFFSEIWDQITAGVKEVGNGIIGGFVGAYNFVTTTWDNLPLHFGAVGKRAWNALMDGMSGDAITFTDPMGNQHSWGLDLSGFKTDISDAENLAFRGTFGNAMDRDYMGELFGNISGTAQDIARARLEVEGLDDATAAANDNAKTLGDTLSDAARRAQEEWEFYRGTFRGFVSDFTNGLREGESIWQSFGNAVVNALNKIADRMLGMAADGIFDMLFGGLMGGLMGGAGASFVPSGFVSGGFYPGLPGGGVGAAGSWMSFNGGGFTGTGPRTGGLDGKGGFPALLHPNETVIDHANQNQANDNRRGGDVHIHINGSGLSEQQLGRAIGDALTRYDSQLVGKVENKFKRMQSDRRAPKGKW